MPKPIYTVTCCLCYSFSRDHSSKRKADMEATSHMNAYGHNVIITTNDGACYAAKPK